jgi:hypothetical protein
MVTHFVANKNKVKVVDFLCNKESMKPFIYVILYSDYKQSL